MSTPISLQKLLPDADAIGIRLEIMNSVPVWEASPMYRHQHEVDRICQSMQIGQSKAARACEHVGSVYFHFKDGSYKRPDIAIICTMPKEEEMDAALEIVPEAVIEVISEGYEDKDMRIAPSFYLCQGVKDVLIFDPRAKLIWHHRVDGVQRLNAPQTLELECGFWCEL
jgi:Uma2 family endonuclease